MKKIIPLLIIFLTSGICFSQQTSVVAKRVEAKDSVKINDRWVKLVNNDTTPLDGQARDIMTSNAVYDFVNERTLQLWLGLADTAANLRLLQGTPTCENKLLTEWNVSWQGVGFNYSVHGGLSDGTGRYQIVCVQYTADSATVTFSAADPDEDRIDIIYLDATGVHTREGDLSAPGTAVRPTVNVDEILLTEVLIAAGTTAPNLTQLIVYDDNLGESTVTNTGTTTNADNTTNTYVGTKSVNVTNITHNDQIFFTKLPSLSTWNVLGFDGLTLSIRLKATMPTNANLGIALQVGTTTSGTEVIVPLVKTNSSSYQQISIPISAFGNMANTNITRVRFRYIRTASGANYTGFYLDYIFFVDGFTGGPSSGSTATFTLNPMVGFTSTPTATQQSPGTWTLTPVGYSSLDNFLSPDGWQNLPEILSAIGTLDGRAKTADGADVDEEEIFLQTVDDTYPGLMTPAMFSKLDSNYYITNLDVAANSDSLVRPVTANITGVKGLKDSTGIGFAVYDDYIAIYATGDGGGGFFTSSASTGATTQDADGNSFNITNIAGFSLQGSTSGSTITLSEIYEAGDLLQIQIGDGDQTISIHTEFELQQASISLNKTDASMTFDSDTGKYWMMDVPEFSDNAAAITGGLTAGRIYRTSDALKVVH